MTQYSIRACALCSLAAVLFLLSSTTATAQGAPPTAAERLQAIVDNLRAHVEEFEAREAPPTADEMAEAEPYIEELRTAIAAVEAEGAGESTELLKGARSLLRRIRALDLVRKAAELRSRVHELGSRAQPPDDAEIEELIQLGRELQSTIEELESESRNTRPTKKSVKEAETAVALSQSAEVLADSNQASELLDSIEGDPSRVSDEEVSAAQQVADDLQAGIEQVENTTGVPPGESEPVGVTRARTILIRLLATILARITTELLPEVDRLEALDAPPTSESLLALQPLVASLQDAIDSLERNMKAGVSEIPPELEAGIALLRRFAGLELARSLADLTPLVEQGEQQQDPLTDEQIVRLREIPGELRPQMRTARRTSKTGDTTGTLTTAPEVTAAADLLQRVQALVPDSREVAEEPVDAPQTQPIARIFRFYGSLRLRALVTEDDGAKLDGQTSRIGVRSQGKVFRNVTGFARGELGFNFLDVEAFRGLDEGRGLDGEQFFFLRLAFIGAELGDNRSISFGKQWSSFYDVGVFSDQMPFFAGAGTAVYSAGSDGGVSGTGRANLALQYRDAINIFKYSIQMQTRNLTDNNQTVADTLGASVTWKLNDRTQLGAAYNHVRDGVPEPEDNQPKENDRALIVGYRYQNEGLYVGSTMTVFNNHDTDDQGVFFSGVGVEGYASYTWSKLSLRGAISFLNPNSYYSGRYRVLSLTSGATYGLTRRLRLTLLTRLDFSKLSDGSDRNGNVVSLSAFYNF